MDMEPDSTVEIVDAEEEERLAPIAQLENDLRWWQNFEEENLSTLERYRDQLLASLRWTRDCNTSLQQVLRDCHREQLLAIDEAQKADNLVQNLILHRESVIQALHEEQSINLNMSRQNVEALQARVNSLLEELAAVDTQPSLISVESDEDEQ